MAIGISTASLYPQLTEEALAYLGTAGVGVTEVFLNSDSETADDFIRQLRGIGDRYGMRITALHPFSSFSEPYHLFTSYSRRFTDGKERFRRFFAGAATLGAKYIVLHGDRTAGELSVEEYCHRYKILYDLGQTYGVTLTQENVSGYRSADPEFLQQMRQALGTDAKFTLDIKQCIRSGHTVEEICNAMGDGVVHIHISDHRPGNDCMLPGNGRFDFSAFFAKMQAKGYCGDYMVEVYRNAYTQPRELIGAYEALL